jgi:hypothetical protein
MCERASRKEMNRSHEAMKLKDLRERILNLGLPASQYAPEQMAASPTWTAGQVLGQAMRFVMNHEWGYSGESEDDGVITGREEVMARRNLVTCTEHGDKPAWLSCEHVSVHTGAMVAAMATTSEIPVRPEQAGSSVRCVHGYRGERLGS